MLAEVMQDAIQICILLSIPVTIRFFPAQCQSGKFRHALALPFLHPSPQNPLWWPCQNRKSSKTMNHKILHWLPIILKKIIKIPSAMYQNLHNPPILQPWSWLNHSFSILCAGEMFSETSLKASISRHWILTLPPELFLVSPFLLIYSQKSSSCSHSPL